MSLHPCTSPDCSTSSNPRVLLSQSLSHVFLFCFVLFCLFCFFVCLFCFVLLLNVSHLFSSFFSVYPHPQTNPISLKATKPFTLGSWLRLKKRRRLVMVVGFCSHPRTSGESETNYSPPTLLLLFLSFLFSSVLFQVVGFTCWIMKITVPISLTARDLNRNSRY